MQGNFHIATLAWSSIKCIWESQACYTEPLDPVLCHPFPSQTTVGHLCSPFFLFLGGAWTEHHVHTRAALSEVFLEVVPTEILGLGKEMFGAFPPSKWDMWHSVCAIATMSWVLRWTCPIPRHDKFWRRPWQRWAWSHDILSSWGTSLWHGVRAL